MTYLVSLAFFFFGAVIASFMALVAERLHTGQSWVQGRSACNSCAVLLAPLDLVPVFSWLFTRGRCRICHARVPALYALSEAILGALFVFGYLSLGISLSLAALFAVLTTLTFIVLYDLRHTVVPVLASTLLIVFSFLYALSVSGSLGEFGASLLAAGLVGMAFLAAHVCSRGRMMGLGDSPVALALALMVGAPLALAGLIFSFWIGAVVGIGILVSTPKGHRMGIEVPFVPFLACGYLLAHITQWNPLLLTF